VYCYFVRPFSNLPACLVAAVSSNNRLNAQTVHDRWKHIDKEFGKHGFSISSVCADGDSRAFLFMRFEHAKARMKCFQDGPHIGVKVLNAFLAKDRIICLPWGNLRRENFFSLAELFACGFTVKDLLQFHTMNYKVASKIFSAESLRIIKCLPGSSYKVMATVVQVGVWATTPFSCKREADLSHLGEKISDLWAAAFFLAIWNIWAECNHLAASTTCFTDNATIGIYLNALSIARLLQDLIQQNPTATFSFSDITSQTCEKYFRSCRSFSPMSVTSTNFSFQEFLRRALLVESIRRGEETKIHEPSASLLTIRENSTKRGQKLFASERYNVSMMHEQSIAEWKLAGYCKAVALWNESSSVSHLGENNPCAKTLK
jgi:hypothetical protein